jgi:hypothetical protein
VSRFVQIFFFFSLETLDTPHSASRQAGRQACVTQHTKKWETADKQLCVVVVVGRNETTSRSTYVACLRQGSSPLRCNALFRHRTPRKQGQGHRHLRAATMHVRGTADCGYLWRTASKKGWHRAGSHSLCPPHHQMWVFGEPLLVHTVALCVEMERNADGAVLAAVCWICSPSMITAVVVVVVIRQKLVCEGLSLKCRRRKQCKISKMMKTDCFINNRSL